MNGYPTVRKNDLDDEQRELWDELTLGPRGFYTGGPEAERLPDLYNAWIQFPEFGKLMLKLGDEIRDCNELSGKLREIVVLTTSSELGAQVEFDFHVPFALNEGLTQAEIDALDAEEVPRFEGEAETATYHANLQLLRSATLAAETRETLVRLIGYPGLTQLIATVMLYAVTAWTTNVARVKLADDFSADPDRLKEFFAGRPSKG